MAPEDFHSPDLSNLPPGTHLPLGALFPKLPPNFAPHLHHLQAPPVLPDGYKLLPPTYDPYLAALTAAAAAGRGTSQLFGNDMFFEMAPPVQMLGMTGFYPGFKFQR